MPTSKTVSATEAKALFSDLGDFPALVLAVSGGPDSTALMVLAARWRKTLKNGPKLIAVTVDHGLRPDSKREAAAVARLARKLGVAHRTVRWIGRKPKTGLQQAARVARYRLLGQAARKSGASHILTAHTLDDQAETVMIRMMRGSGVTGLGAMTRTAALPGDGRGGIVLLRPLLGVSKSRLVATLNAERIPCADDPSNRDPRFTRARLRGLMPQLAREGLDARRLSLLAERLKRADLAIETVVDQAMDTLAGDGSTAKMMTLDAPGLFLQPAEIGLRVIGRAVGRIGDEGPVELAKLEALKAALDSALKARDWGFRRSLAGALVTLAWPQLKVEKAPPRRRSSNALTKRRPSEARPVKTR